MKNKNIFRFVVAVLLFLLAAQISLVLTKPKTKTVLGQASDINVPTASSVTQKIIYGQGKVDLRVIEAQTGDTVLSLLIKSKNPEIKQYSFGQAVESIDGYKNGQDKKYWLYQVNGKEANIGAGEYQVQNNDQIVWSFQ